MTQKKPEVRGQATCEKYLRSCSNNYFKCYYGTNAGFTIAIIKDGRIEDICWNVRYRGAIHEDTLEQMLDFINKADEPEKRQSPTD